MLVSSRLRRWLVIVLAALGLLVLTVTFTPVVWWYADWLSGPRDVPRGDVLIVLGGSSLGPHILGLSSHWRSVYADLAWRDGGFRQVVVSGAGVALPMRDYLVSCGIPAAAIIVEDRSTSTREQAANVARLLAGTPGVKVLLTSDYHMFRARRAFRKAGLEVRPRPFPDALKRYSHFSGRWPAFLDLAGESVKIVYYRLRGWI